MVEKDQKRKAFVIRELRRASLKWPPRYACKKAARVGKGLYKCSECGGVFKDKEVHLDHIEPVVDPKVGFVDYNTYVSRLLCEQSNFATLCIFCHSAKTNKEFVKRK